MRPAPLVLVLLAACQAPTQAPTEPGPRPPAADSAFQQELLDALASLQEEVIKLRLEMRRLHMDMEAQQNPLARELLLERQTELLFLLDKLQRGFGDQHPQIQAVFTELAAVRQRLAEIEEAAID